MNYKHEIAEDGGFRCQRGDHIRPQTQLMMQDGLPVCELHRDEMSALELAKQLADDEAEGARREDLGRRFPAEAYANDFAGAPGITAISPSQLSLAHGGASGVITLTGVNFAATDSITGSTGLAITPSIAATLITLTVSAGGGMTPGLYSITYNGQTYRGLVKVT